MKIKKIKLFTFKTINVLKRAAKIELTKNTFEGEKRSAKPNIEKMSVPKINPS